MPFPYFIEKTRIRFRGSRLLRLPLRIFKQNIYVNMSNTQTLLGATGIIGKEIAQCLPTYTQHIRLVSRNPQKIHETDELIQADLLDAQQTLKAVEGSDIVYLTVGLPYDSKIWQSQWPPIMQNTINACQQVGAKLVFFDNVYPLGKVEGPIKEDAPINPISKKGAVRAEILRMLTEAMGKGGFQAMSVRAADFYGPQATTSVLNLLVLERLYKKKAAQWLIREDVPHSFTYTRDAARATALLGNTPEAYNQIWHLPTASPALTGKELINLAADILEVPPKYTVLPKWMLRMIGLFSTPIRELIEMSYQNDSDYIFDSSKFEQAFNMPPTSYKQGLQETIEIIKTQTPGSK